MGSSADDLPHELLINIFVQLGRKDHFNCMFVNKNWCNVIGAYIIYRHVCLFREKDLDRFLTLLEQTSLNRRYPQRQSFYSRMDYGSLVRSINIPWNTSSRIALDGSKLKRLATHCNNIESISLNDHWNLNDDQVIEVYQRCPRLRHLDLRGAFYTTVESLLKKSTTHLCNQLKSLDVRHTYDFWSSKLDVCLPSLTELRIDLSSESDFVRLRNLLSHCSESLRILVIACKSQDCGSGFDYLNQALRDLPNLTKLALSGSRKTTVQDIHIAPKINNLEICELKIPELAEKLSALTNLRRLVLWNCKISSGNINTILFRNRNTMETFMHTENSSPVLQFADIAAPIDISSCTNLRCVLAALNDINSNTKWISDAYRNQLEHLYITMNVKGDYLLDEWWTQIAESPWPNIKSVIFSGILLPERYVRGLPAIFPNIEYIYFELRYPRDESNEFPVMYFDLPYLKGAAGFQWQIHPWTRLDHQTARQLERWEVYYNEWVKGPRLGTNDDYPLLSPFRGLPFYLA